MLDRARIAGTAAGGMLSGDMASLMGLAAKQAAKEEELAAARNQVGEWGGSGADALSREIRVQVWASGVF